jgi:hypothetical protein
MPGTRRTPIARRSVASITPQAVAIFREMSKCKCSCGNYPDPTIWTGRAQCSGCTTWWALHSELADHIKHQVWEWPLIPCITRYPVFDRDAGRFTDVMEPPEQGNERQRELDRVLREAARTLPHGTAKTLRHGDGKSSAENSAKDLQEATTDVAVERDATTDNPDAGASPSAPDA